MTSQGMTSSLGFVTDEVWKRKAVNKEKESPAGELRRRRSKDTEWKEGSVLCSLLYRIYV